MKDPLSIFCVPDPDDFRGFLNTSPQSFADKYPDIPKPEARLSPRLLAVQWATHDLYGEDMPGIAADMLEAAHDTPSVPPLAGQYAAHCPALIKNLAPK